VEAIWLALVGVAAGDFLGVPWPVTLAETSRADLPALWVAWHMKFAKFLELAEVVADRLQIRRAAVMASLAAVPPLRL
jgi:hypothetical protein